MIKRPDYEIQILLGDSSAHFSELLTRSLPDFAVRVADVAKSPNEAYALLHKSDAYDAVLCDIHLAADFGGISLLHRIKEADCLNPKTAFLFTTADTDKGHLLAGIEAQPDGIILKPFALQELSTRLKTAQTERLAVAQIIKCIRAGNFENALTNADLLLKSNTRHWERISKLKALIFNKTGNSMAEAAIYKKVLARSPYSYWATEGLARLAYDVRKYGEASELITKLMATAPAYMGSYDLLANINHTLHNTMAAQDVLLKGVTISPFNASRHRELGYTAILNQDLALAVTAFRNAARITNLPSDFLDTVRAHLLRGDDYLARTTLLTAKVVVPEPHVWQCATLFVQAHRDKFQHSLAQAKRTIILGLSHLNKLKDLPQTDQVVALCFMALEACMLMSHNSDYVRNLVKTTITLSTHRQLSQPQLNWLLKLKHAFQHSIELETLSDGFEPSPIVQ